MKKNIFIAIILVFVMLFSACGGKTQNKSFDENMYYVEDKQMEGMFNFDELQNITPELEKVCEREDGISGYLIGGVKYNETISKSFIWMGFPDSKKTKEGYKAVLLIHGGGGNAFYDWVKFWNEKGYVAVSIDIGGQMFDGEEKLVKNPNFLCNGSWGSISCGYDENSFRKSWTYMNIVNCIMVNNYLRSLPDINSEKIVVTGISWGGYLTSILAGVDKRFKAFAPVYGCGDMANDSWGLETAGLIGLSEENRKKWTALYDPISYLPYASRPILFTSGMTDHAFSSIAHKNSTNVVLGKKFFAYSLSLEHGHYWKKTPCVELFFNHILDGTALGCYINSVEIIENEVLIDVESDVEFVALSTTKSKEEDSHLWQWENEAISLKKGINKISVPTDTTALIMSLYDENVDYVVMSTDILLFN